MTTILLAEGANAGIDGAKAILESVTAEISIANVVAVLGVGLGVAAGFFLMYWGGRKLIKMLTSAFKKGKIAV